MSENLHNIDKLFKQAIDQHEEEPSSKAWDAIDKNLDKSKVVSISRKYNKLKWVAAALLLFSIGMAMYVWQTNVKRSETVKGNKKTSGKNDNTGFIKTPEKSTDQPAAPASENNSSNKEQEVSPKQEDATVQNNNAKTLPVNNNNTANDKNTVPQQKLKSNVAVKENVSQKNEKQNIIKEKSKQNVIKEENKINPTDAVVKNDQEQKQDNQQKNNISPQDQNKEKQNNIANTSSQPKNNSVQPPVTKQETKADNDLAINNQQKTTQRSPKTKAAKTSKGSLLAATVFFSPDIVTANVKNDHPRFREDDPHEIKKNEHQETSFTAGILVGYNLSKKLKVETGVTVFTRTTDIDNKTIYARPDQNGNINFRVSCSFGPAYVPLKNNGTPPAQGDSAKALSGKSTLQYVGVPLGLKYSFGKGKLKISPAVGVSINFLSKSNIETVVATQTANEKTSTSDIQGLKSHYFNGSVGIGAEYELNKKLSVSITPSARFALSSINKDAPVKTSLNSIGIGAGISIKF